MAPRWLVGVARPRRGAPQAVQDPLFEIEVRPERRYFRQILQALTGVLSGDDPLRAELAVSRVLGVIWTSDPSRDGAAEEAFGAGLVDFARQQHTPIATNLLRVLAVVGTLRETRELAADALDDTVAPARDWTPPVGAVTAGRCWLAEDMFGDLVTVVCEFGYGADPRHSPRHGLAVQIDQANYGTAIDISLLDDVDTFVRELRYGNSVPANEEFHRIDQATAGSMLERAFARTDLLPATVVSADFAALRALALARVRVLPLASIPVIEASVQRRAAVVAEFRRSTEAQHLRQPDRVAQLLVEFAARLDPADLLRVSPGRLEAFLEDPATATSGIAMAEIAEVVRAWSSWASRQAGMPMLTREALAHAVDALLDEYLHLEDVGRPQADRNG